MDDNNSWYEPLNTKGGAAPAPIPAISEGAPSEEIWDTLLEGIDEAPEAPQKEKNWKRKSKGGFFKVLALILLIALLAYATAFVFGRLHIEATDDGLHIQYGDSNTQDSGGIFGFTPPELTDPSEDPDEIPNDPADFFENFFTQAETADVEVKMSPKALPFDYELELEDPTSKTLTLQELYAQCSNSIVAILGYSDGLEFSWGTGVVLTDSGIIITNTHVIDDCDSAKVTLWNDEVYDATLIGADVTSDIALLKIEAEDLLPAHFCKSDSLAVGDEVVAIGNPLGESFRSTLTNGIISGIDRGVSYNGRTMTVLQTNTALNSGNSGGALFNMQGQVIGITNMKMMSNYSSIEGIGFAIPTSTIVQIVNGLVKDGEFRGRPSIGMTVGAVPELAQETYSMPSGLYVTDVTKGSGADKAGIKKGDVILTVYGQEVLATDDVLAILEGFSVGDMLPITLWRDGETINVEVELMDTNDIYG